MFVKHFRRLIYFQSSRHHDFKKPFLRIMILTVMNGFQEMLIMGQGTDDQIFLCSMFTLMLLRCLTNHQFWWCSGFPSGSRTSLKDSCHVCTREWAAWRRSAPSECFSRTFCFYCLFLFGTFFILFSQCFISMLVIPMFPFDN